ncbi:predicted protein [Nematostella vectensis]|uniref:Myb-like domain-containing protein n=1 Tax=Nematostella vectensis TaxID=45351 RepID=A7SB42_NEMVE|nr:predicted protein [Nematostella vectensis]|eukprot:XP_001631114.1 predicted protein [Nematostella vectensis]
MMVVMQKKTTKRVKSRLLKDTKGITEGFDGEVVRKKKKERRHQRKQEKVVDVITGKRKQNDVLDEDAFKSTPQHDDCDMEPSVAEGCDGSRMKKKEKRHKHKFMEFGSDVTTKKQKREYNDAFKSTSEDDNCDMERSGVEHVEMKQKIRDYRTNYNNKISEGYDGIRMKKKKRTRHKHKLVEVTTKKQKKKCKDALDEDALKLAPDDDCRIRLRGGENVAMKKERQKNKGKNEQEIELSNHEYKIKKKNGKNQYKCDEESMVKNSKRGHCYLKKKEYQHLVITQSKQETNIKKKKNPRGMKKSKTKIKILNYHGQRCKCADCRKRYKGRWSYEEHQILLDNLRKISLESGAEDLQSDLFKNVRLKNGKAIKWKEFVSQMNFYEKVMQGLNRSFKSVYNVLYYNIKEQKKNAAGSFTEEEIRELKKLHHIYGNNWKEISAVLYRSYFQVYIKWCSLGGARGPWSDEEIKRLRDAVTVLTESKGQTAVFKDINWKLVSFIVGTRNYFQCFKKWQYSPNIAFICANKKNRRWTDQDSCKLIKAVYESDAFQECELDFHQIYSSWNGSSCIVSPFFLAMKWNQLKRKFFDNYKIMSFDDIVDEMYNIHLPKIERSIKEFDECVERAQKAMKKSRKQAVE